MAASRLSARLAIENIKYMSRFLMTRPRLEIAYFLNKPPDMLLYISFFGKDELEASGRVINEPAMTCMRKKHGYLKFNRKKRHLRET